jgi:hypothetical protein
MKPVIVIASLLAALAFLALTLAVAYMIAAH